MESKICTTVDQSRKLKELGLDPNTADMYWVDAGGNQFYLGIGKHAAIQHNLFSYRHGHIIPAWSLSASLESMPILIIEPSNPLLLSPANHVSWAIEYTTDISSAGDTPIDAAYSMVCMLIEKGYIKKEEV